jgi:hypothetical protein
MFELTMAASRRTEYPTCALQLANEVSNLHGMIVTQADRERKVAECRGDRYAVRPRTGSIARHRERTPNNVDGIRPQDSERHTRNRSISYSRHPLRNSSRFSGLWLPKLRYPEAPAAFQRCPPRPLEIPDDPPRPT